MCNWNRNTCSFHMSYWIAKTGVTKCPRKPPEGRCHCRQAGGWEAVWTAAAGAGLATARTRWSCSWRSMFCPCRILAAASANMTQVIRRRKYVFVIFRQKNTQPISLALTKIKCIQFLAAKHMIILTGYRKNSKYYVFQVIIPLKQIQLILTTKSQNFKREKAVVRQEVKWDQD